MLRAGTPAADALLWEHTHIHDLHEPVAARVKALLLAKNGISNWLGKLELLQPSFDYPASIGSKASARLRLVAEWAATIVERCAVPGPGGGPDLALLPVICQLPKAGLACTILHLALPA
jgi:hypothetical protein